MYSFMSGTLLCCTVLYCFFVLHCIALGWIVLHCLVLYCFVLHCTVMFCIALYCIIYIYCISLFCGVLYCTVLYCIVLFCIVWYAFLMSLMSNYCRRSTAAILPDSYNAMSLWLGTAGDDSWMGIEGCSPWELDGFQSWPSHGNLTWFSRIGMGLMLIYLEDHPNYSSKWWVIVGFSFSFPRCRWDSGGLGTCNQGYSLVN